MATAYHFEGRFKPLHGENFSSKPIFAETDAKAAVEMAKEIFWEWQEEILDTDYPESTVQAVEAAIDNGPMLIDIRILNNPEIATFNVKIEYEPVFTATPITPTIT